MIQNFLAVLQLLLGTFDSLVGLLDGLGAFS